KDKTLYILLFGGIIFMIGVAQGSYWNHRRIWIQKSEGDELVLAGHTNKNWFDLKKDLDKVNDFANLPPYKDRQDAESSSDEVKGDNS
ncbi:cytochrome c biogenesis protein ResB, partial [Microvirga sp. 3-52]|nr:cytochrome c biogenesis protein ResB [Microvirga sp. 3-52]